MTTHPLQVRQNQFRARLHLGGQKFVPSVLGFERASCFWGFQVRLRRKTWLGNTMTGLSTPKFMMLPDTTLHTILFLTGNRKQIIL